MLQLRNTELACNKHSVYLIFVFIQCFQQIEVSVFEVVSEKFFLPQIFLSLFGAFWLMTSFRWFLKIMIIFNIPIFIKYTLLCWLIKIIWIGKGSKKNLWLKRLFRFVFPKYFHEGKSENKFTAYGKSATPVDIIDHIS